MSEEEQETRAFFNDGWNSFWRLVAGMFASQFPSIILPACLTLQVISPSISVDLQEFLVGYILGTVIYGFVRVSLMITHYIP